MVFRKMLINLRKKGNSGIIPFVYVGKVDIHKYMKCEVSMAAYVGRIANQRKISK